MSQPKCKKLKFVSLNQLNHYFIIPDMDKSSVLILGDYLHYQYLITKILEPIKVKDITNLVIKLFCSEINKQLFIDQYWPLILNSTNIYLKSISHLYMTEYMVNRFSFVDNPFGSNSTDFDGIIFTMFSFFNMSQFNPKNTYMGTITPVYNFGLSNALFEIQTDKKSVEKYADGQSIVKIVILYTSFYYNVSSEPYDYKNDPRFHKVLDNIYYKFLMECSFTVNSLKISKNRIIELNMKVAIKKVIDEIQSSILTDIKNGKLKWLTFTPI